MENLFCKIFLHFGNVLGDNGNKNKRLTFVKALKLNYNRIKTYMEISIVVPIFNEEENLPTLYQRLEEVMEKLAVDYELLFVNDGSSDSSIQILKEYASKNAKVKYIDFSRNFGHQIAVSAGLEHAKGQAVVIIDGDLQDPPEIIEPLYKKLKEGFEVVYAQRISRKGESVFKKMTANVFYRILGGITTVHIPVDTGDFRIMDRKVVDVLLAMPEHNKFIRGQVAWVGFRQTSIEYHRDERFSGETGYTFRKMLNFALDGITAFSNFPLKLVTFAGFFVSSITFFIMLYALYSKYILKDFVAGWTSLMLSVLFIGGIQLISIGIIGEYISRINNNVRNRPLYVIKEKKTD